MRMRPSRCSPVLRPAAFALSFAVVLLGLGACQTTDLQEVTGALGGGADKTRAPGGDPRAELDQLRERFRATPNDPDVALRYGTALRGTGQRSQAVAVLEQATIANPSNKALLAAYGRALADNGNFQQAFDVLSRAHSPEDPDWRILSAQANANVAYVKRILERRQVAQRELATRRDRPAAGQTDKALARALSRADD